MIKELCKKYTSLTEDDIIQLEQMGAILPYFCELTNTDLFIDCFSDNEEIGVVIAQAQPTQGESLYNRTIIGEIVLPENEPTVFRTKRFGVPFRDLAGITQENRRVMQRVVPIKNKQGVIIGTLIEERDITSSIYKNKKIEELTKTTAQLTESLLNITGSPTLITNNVSDGIVIFNDKLEATYINPEARRIYNNLGYKGNLIGHSFEKLFLNTPEEMQLVLAGSKTEQEIAIGEKSLIIKYQQSRGTADNGIIMLINDISQIKEKEKELIHKTVAVQEMHHRIKNNLQTITSILSLQVRRSHFVETKAALNENINRVNSIAAIHEMLTNEALDECVSLIDLLKKLRTNIKSFATTEDKLIEIEIIGDDMLVSGDTAVSIALVINELITNAIKHGFEGKQSGMIKVVIMKGTLYSTITVEDNGWGMSNLEDCVNHLGLELVNIIVKDKLKGNLEIQSDTSGVKIGFDFKAI